MQELIEAAKAVIAEWDEQLVVGDRNLRAAVERAEKQEALGFDDWWDTAGTGTFDDAKYIWGCAQQAERERVQSIILGMDKTLGITWTPEWTQCVNVIMEKINE